MTLAASLATSLAFPGSKTLAGWWRQLASHQPRAFGVGYLFLHRVETAVQVVKPRKVDPLLLLLLQALEHESTIAASASTRDLLARLEGRLCLNRQMLFQILRSLESEELARGRAGVWELTDNGRRALSHGEYPVQAADRRVLHYLERWRISGERVSPPQFVNLRGDGGQPWSAEDCPFDPAWIGDCVARPVDWKSQHGFPLEIQRALPPSAECDRTSDEPSAWQRVIVDRPERHLVAWILAPGSGEHACLLAFAARQEGWALHSVEPLLSLPEDWPESLPGLIIEPDMESLRCAWKTWAHSRGLTEADTDGATLALAGHFLDVQPASAALERLKKAKSDVFKGDTWLLIGDGLIRTAVVLRLK